VGGATCGLLLRAGNNILQGRGGGASAWEEGGGSACRMTSSWRISEAASSTLQEKSVHTTSASGCLTCLCQGRTSCLLCLLPWEGGGREGPHTLPSQHLLYASHLPWEGGGTAAACHAGGAWECLPLEGGGKNHSWPHGISLHILPLTYASGGEASSVTAMQARRLTFLHLQVLPGLLQNSSGGTLGGTS